MAFLSTLEGGRLSKICKIILHKTLPSQCPSPPNCSQLNNDDFGSFHRRPIMAILSILEGGDSQ
jgi:hypothetical protein